MKTSRTRRCNIAASLAQGVAALPLLFVAAGMPANAQFKAVGPPPYAATVARQKIRTALGKIDPSNRQPTIATISGLLSWYRDIADEELIAVWKKDDGRENLPEVIKALADARVASAVVEFSWRQQRQATFQLTYAPLFGNLMLRFPDSAKPFLDDLLGSGDTAAGQPAPDLSEPEAYAVCRILLDMPDIRTWRSNALQILPHYREVAENLLAADLNEGVPEKRTRALRWTADLKSSAPGPASQPSGRRIMQPSLSATAGRTPGPASPATQAASAPLPFDGAMSGTLECSGDPIPQNAEYVFHNVPTVKRRFEYDRKIWDVRLVPGDGDTQDLILKNKSSRPQKRCVVHWSVIP
jgi:hypothetical protein